MSVAWLGVYWKWGFNIEVAGLEQVEVEEELVEDDCVRVAVDDFWMEGEPDAATRREEAFMMVLTWSCVDVVSEAGGRRISAPDPAAMWAEEASAFRREQYAVSNEEGLQLHRAKALPLDRHLSLCHSDHSARKIKSQRG